MVDFYLLCDMVDTRSKISWSVELNWADTFMIGLYHTFYSCTVRVLGVTILKYIEDLTWVLMFYWIYQTSWGKMIKCKACRAFYHFFATSLINSIIQEHECWILFITLLKYFCTRDFGVKMSKFSHEYVKLLWASFHNVTCSRESVNR